MRSLLNVALVISLLAAPAFAQTTTKKKPATKAPAAPAIKLDHPPGVYAVFDTTMGRIVCRLFPDKAPLTVKNFIDLTNGKKRWFDEKKNAWAERRYYDGLIFHRVIPNFMIQGGDQMGTGRGNIGFTFKDEFHPELKFDRPGLLAMANAGPNTNGGQFFITVAPADWLNNRHTIFGEVVEGQDVVVKISEVPRGENDKPTTPVVMNKVTIVNVRAPAAATTPRKETP
jgi:peptidyl-prolyl cis-trans isomerase A (cyclophilin A)